MNERTFESPEWFRALTLEERAASLGEESGGDPGSPVDPERADSRLHRWRSQVPFSRDGFFARRLAAAGLSEASFRYLLGEPSEDLARRARGVPDWLATFEAAFSTQSPDVYPAPSLSEGAHAHLALFEVVRPLLDAGASRLRREIRKLASGRDELLFDPDTAADLFAGSLASRLILLLGRTMVLELNLAGREGKLTGETPEARFQSFATSLRDRERALGILRQYPVLARQVVETVDRWVAASLDFLRHFSDDATALRDAFFPDVAPGPLVRIEGGLGDSHRGGRSVVIAELASGLRLVYKPKPMRVERAFQNLLAWVGEKGFAPMYRLLRMVDGGDHGWVEMVEAGPCSTREEMERFYCRQGGYLALLYLLSATDFHHENLIAAGEHPVLVDLEALFHPWAEDLGSTSEEGLRMGRPVFETVLRTGLLPLRSREGGGEPGLDLSGLAATAGQRAPVLMSEKPGTDAMRYVRRVLEIPVGRHRPTLLGAEVLLREFLGPLLDGFTSMTRLLAEYREELAAPGSVLDAFADSEVRVILRPTRTYAMLQVEAQHPFVLGDALDRDRLLDRLWEAVEERPSMAGLVGAERRDLLRGDIPLFTARPDSRDLWASDGERFPGFLPFSGLEAARERLARFGEEDLARQAWIIHDSIEALALQGQDLPPYRLDPRTEAPSREEILETARGVGRRLEEMALRAPGEAHWLCVQSQGPGTPWALDVTGLDLHLGLPGIVLFLAYLGAVTGEARWTRLARDGAASLRWRIHLLPRRLRFIGAFSGWGGPLYALTHLAALWNEPALLDDAEAIVSFLPDLIESDEDLDVVTGAAGCILCLLRLSEQRPSAATLSAAIRCGERLLARAVPAGSGIGWVLPIAGPRPLAGLSHGTAGIVLALLQLATVTGEERFRQAALQGLVYERSLYAPEARNWPDLRNSSEDGEPFFMNGWCHGAPGIGLARLASLRHLDVDGEIRKEIAAAVETTLTEGFGQSHCLCHGDLGNLELLLLAQEALGLDLAPRIGGVLGGVLADARAHGWRFGLPGRTEPPGLMLGLAGIGYGWLRAAEPRVPSILVLASPPNGISDSANLPPGSARGGVFERSTEDG